MKYTFKIFTVVLSVLILIVTSSFSAMATSLETGTTIDENEQEDSSGEETQEESASDNQLTSEEVTEQNGIIGDDEMTQSTEMTPSTENTEDTSTEETEYSENNETVGGISQTEDSSETDPEQTTENIEEETSKDSVIDWDELLSGQTTKSGLYYYIQKYQYDCQAIYLEQYIAYIEKQISAFEKMYELGDCTENVVKSYEAQKTLVEAELQIARNESRYNNLYLEKNELDYSDYNMKELKDVQSIEYYIENYPEKDYMTLARYVTDYNNVVVSINAKQVAIEALETDVNIASLLLQEGEISQLELAEKEVALAQAQYELEQYYANMNMAYYNLTQICE